MHILGKNPLRHLSWLSEFGSRAESSDLEEKMERTIARGQKETIPDYCHPWGWGEGIVSTEAECICINSKLHSFTQFPTYPN